MNIDRRGRERTRWDLAEAPDGAVEVTFDGAVWHPADRTENTVSVLIAGPDATSNPDGTVVLAEGRHHALLRVAASPEVLIREAGVIDIITSRPAPATI